MGPGPFPFSSKQTEAWRAKGSELASGLFPEDEGLGSGISFLSTLPPAAAL